MSKSKLDALKAVYQWVTRTMMKDQTGVMQTLPKKDLVDFNVAMTAERLMRNGFDPMAFKNANQVENAINQIEAPRNVQQGIKSTDSAKVFDMEGKEIPKGSKIMGGKQAETEEEILARINEENKKAVKSLKERKRPDVYTLDDYDTTNMSDIQKEIIKTETKLGNLNPKSPDFRERAKPLIDKIEELKDQMSKIKEDDLPMAQGGRAGFKSGLGPKFLNFLKSLTKEKPFSGKEFVDKRKFIKADEIENKIQMMKNKKFLEETRKEFKKNPPFKFPEPGDKEYDEGLARIQRALIEDRKLNADGGRAGYKFGIGPLFNFLNKKSPMKAYTDYLKSVKDRMKAGKEAEVAGEVIPIAASGALITNQLKKKLKAMNEEQKKELRKDMEKKADGGRIGLKDGMTRRTFLKLLGGLASIPIVGKILKPMKVGKTVTKVPMIKTDDVAGKPEWFDALVNKVIMEGDDVTKRFATAERQSIHQKTLDDGSVVRVTEDIDDGAVRVEYESDKNVFGDDVQLQYKKPLPDEGDPRPTAEFTTAESGPVGRRTGPDDYDIDVDEVGGTSIKDLDSDVSKLKEYATGQKLTMKELVESIKRKDKASRITEGGDEMIDAVTRRQGDYDPYASGGIARMLGEK